MLIDTHVHLYPCHDAGVLLDAAAENFRRGGATSHVLGVLMFTETCRDQAFADLASGNLLQDDASWSVQTTSESTSRLLQHVDGSRLIIIAGRQIITRERLEVLALATDTPFEDGMTITDTLQHVQANGGLPVLPWGVGKWLGKRGEIIRKVIDNNATQGVLVADNGNRCRWTPTPRLIRHAEKHNITVLAGSDPLPLANHQSRVGSYGVAMDEPVSIETPAADILGMMQKHKGPMKTFGERTSFFGFVSSQTRLRLPHS